MFFIHRILHFIWEIVIENFTNGIKTNVGVKFLKILVIFALFFLILLLNC